MARLRAGGRQCDRDRRSFARAARHFDPPLMRLDDGLGDRQAQAQALLIIAGGVAAPAETLEDPFQLLRRNADAAVGDAAP